MRLINSHKHLLAVGLSALLLAGCSSTRDGGHASMVPPIDQTKHRPDTHPELRNSAWSTAYSTQYRVIEAPTRDIDEQAAAVNDTPVLLSANRLSRSAVDVESGEVIDEAAGAAKRASLPKPAACDCDAACCK